MPEIYVNDPSEVGLIGPFVSKDMAKSYMYDTKQVWEGFALVEAPELDNAEKIIDPEVEYLTVRFQVNRPSRATKGPLREYLEEGLDRWNDELGSGPQFYIIETDASTD